MHPDIIYNLEGLIVALQDMLDHHGDMPVRAAVKGQPFPFKIAGVCMTNDNASRSNPDGTVIQLLIEE